MVQALRVSAADERDTELRLEALSIAADLGGTSDETIILKRAEAIYTWLKGA